MRHIFFSLTLLFCTLSLNGSESNLTLLPYKKNVKEKILEGSVFSESKVDNSTLAGLRMQSLNFSIAGLHTKNCQYALKKLSLYENYRDFLDFVKDSRYTPQTEEINFLLSHVLMPYDMRLVFKLARITRPGIYPYRFDVGILKNLTGNIHVQKYTDKNHSERCLFYTTATWSGVHTGIPNFILEGFSQALAKYSMERLFRLSSTLSH